MSIVVRGTVQEVEAKLIALSAVIKHRKMVGWPLFQSDEEWTYITRGDARVCNICWEIESKGRIVGSEIPSRFPFYEVISYGEVHPHTHADCRCRMIWEHPAETLERRLHLEKQAVV